MGRRGRPFVKDKRKKQCMIRINDAENNMLADVCKMTGMGQADVFRTALERMYHAEYMRNGECSELEEKFKEEHPLSPILDKRYGKKSKEN